MDSLPPLPPQDMTKWADRWRSGRTAWDQGGPHPGLVRLVAEAREWDLLPAGGQILEPGCGRAHGSAWLAQQGFHAVAFDGVAEAVDAARGLYGTVENLELRVQDALSPVPEWQGRFNAVYDRAVLCALPRELRRRYVEVCFSHLAPGGLLLTIPFTALKISEAEGPPFEIPMPALAELLSPGFALVHAEDWPVEGDAKLKTETLCVWKRRSRFLLEST